MLSKREMVIQFSLDDASFHAIKSAISVVIMGGGPFYPTVYTREVSSLFRYSYFRRHSLPLHLPARARGPFPPRHPVDYTFPCIDAVRHPTVSIH